MASLVNELQMDAVNEAVPVSSLLRKALIIASWLEVSAVPEWIGKELSGYSPEDTIPSYRVIHGSVKAAVLPGRWISVQFPTNDIATMISERKVHQRIAELDSLRNQGKKVMFGYADEAQAFLQNMFSQQAEFACVIQTAMIDGIINEVRNRVLNWAIQLDKAGVSGKGLSSTASGMQAAQSIGTQHIYQGPVAAVSHGESKIGSVTQSIGMSPDPRLADALRGLIDALNASKVQDAGTDGALSVLVKAESDAKQGKPPILERIKAALAMVSSAEDLALKAPEVVSHIEKVWHLFGPS